MGENFGDNNNIVSISWTMAIAGGISAWRIRVGQSSGCAELAPAVFASYQADGSAGTSPYRYDTKLMDTHGAVTTGANWKFTAPVSGYYNIEGDIYPNTNSWSGIIYLFKNGVSYREIMRATPSSNNTGYTGYHCMIYLVANEYISIGGSTTILSYGFVDILLVRQG